LSPEAIATHASEEEVARRVAAGDRAAEVELCRRFAPRVRLYGLRHLREEERARDLVQSVLLVVLEALRAGKVDEPEHIDRFVLGTARNLSMKQRAADDRTELREPGDLDVHSHLPEHAAVDAGALFGCIEGLEPRARTILFMSFYRDKTAQEIAGALQTTAGNVRVLRHRAFAQLRDCLDGHREGP
jgi:RNA polymerase sigma-70 factor (ECF subfamily)